MRAPRFLRQRREAEQKINQENLEKQRRREEAAVWMRERESKMKAMQAKEKEMIKEVRANFRAKLHNNTHSRKRPSSAGMKMKQKQEKVLVNMTTAATTYVEAKLKASKPISSSRSRRKMRTDGRPPTTRRTKKQHTKNIYVGGGQEVVVAVEKEHRKLRREGGASRTRVRKSSKSLGLQRLRNGDVARLYGE